MFVTETLEFQQETLDTSVENFAQLIQNYTSRYARTCNNVAFLIIMKKISEHLKNHPDSKLCDIPLSSLIFQIRDNCIKFLEREDPNFVTFKTTKLQELNLNTTKYTSTVADMLKVWFFIDRVIPMLEDNFSRGRYGYGYSTYFS